jgi:RNA polymerase subunit RPABC4/transcription elongation factor Spt4
MRTGGADRKRGLARDKEWLAIVLIPIVLVVIVIILRRRESGIARGIGRTLLFVGIYLPPYLVWRESGSDGALIVVLVYFGLLIFLLPFYGMYRAARDEKWPWFWAILGTTFLGLGLIFSLIYLRRYRPRPEMELRCGDCDAIVSDSAKFCPGCGGAFDQNLCPSCGAKSSEGAKFCDECGTDLKAET